MTNSGELLLLLLLLFAGLISFSSIRVSILASLPTNLVQFVLPLNSERAISLFYDKHNWLCNQFGEIIIDEEEKGTRIHLDIKLTVFNVSPTIAWRFFERYFDEILSIPWRYNVRTLTWFERNAYDTIVSRKKISWSFSRVFSSGGEHATERSSFKTSCWEHECPFDSSFNGVVKKKKTFAIQSRRYSKWKTNVRRNLEFMGWEKYVMYLSMFRININNTNNNKNDYLDRLENERSFFACIATTRDNERKLIMLTTIYLRSFSCVHR